MKIAKGSIQPNTKVEVRDIPWKGVVATYIRPTHILWMRAHLVEVGDFISGGTPRRVKVRKIVRRQG